MNGLFFDTIAAVSTPRGKGGIAVLRISGSEAAAVLSRVFTPRKTDPKDAPRRACFGLIHTPTGDVLDEGLVTFFPAPASFTGEDVAEISCHGGALLTQTVLAAVLTAGARAATAGEFTRRALTNGKMGLSSAEALGALLEAQTQGQLALARGGMTGKLADAARAAYERLTAILADIYAKIDFPDEDLNTMGREDLLGAIAGVKADLQALAATYRTGHAVGEGITTVICGPVNAGKSTLYNALVGRDAAIVTEIAGTTRDVLSETVMFGGVTLRLFDTAGLRDTTDTVERIGVARSKQLLDEAELVLAVLDGSRDAAREEQDLLAHLAPRSASVIVILNKGDLPAAFPRDQLAAFPHVVSISAATGALNDLSDTVHSLFLSDALDVKQDAIVANARQFAAISRAAEMLEKTEGSLLAGIPLDLCASDAELAMSALGEVDGRAVDEDIVASVFSHFCVGK